MKTAILMRGHHYYTNPYWMVNENSNRHVYDLNSRCSHSPRSFDYRDCFKNIEDNVINPIRNISDVDIYITTQHSDIEKTLYDIKGITKVVHPDYPESQNSTTKKGIEQINDSYDCYLIMRFDLQFKQSILNLWDYKRKETVFCLWKESTHVGMPWEKNLWEQHNRLPDTMHIINGGKTWNCFKKAINDFYPDNNCSESYMMPWGELITPARGLHHLYPFLIKNCCTIDFLVDNFYACDTSLPYTCSKNPIYALYGRSYHFDDYPTV